MGLSVFRLEDYSQRQGYLSLEQERATQAHFTEHSARNAYEVCAYILAEHGQNYSSTGAAKLMGRLGFVYKDLCTIGNSLTLPNLYLLEDHIRDFMDIFSCDSASRIGDQNVLRKVNALMDWSAISVLLKNGLKRSGLRPQR